ncbi:AGE family epimerase/isomerase [Paracoccus aestuarii]|nr:AGE family epimerase/isomerase [Paracoccus aestuarii]
MNPLDDAAHRAFLIADAHRALDFFDASLRPQGGFHALDHDGTPLDGPQELHVTTRMVHCQALAQMAGRDDRAGVMDHGMQALWHLHRDADHGGYHWALRDGQPVEGPKLAYGHVFVLLAASGALMRGHPLARPLFDDITRVLDAHFWDEDAGLFRDEFTRDWRPFSTYRGMNANMHGVEALLAAHEATGARVFLDRAGRILDFFVTRQAAARDWRIPEHYGADWRPDPDYAGDPMFRPAGTTPGHSVEMARLTLHWWDLAGRPDDGTPDRARALVDRALADAWDAEQGGLAYTIAIGGGVADPARYWWPVTEAIGALAALLKLDPRPGDADWYRRLWDFADRRLIDHARGGWFPQAGPDGPVQDGHFAGKPDLYHALQADLLPLAPGLSRQMGDLSQARPLRLTERVG